MAARLRQLFSIDLRSLALFRVLLAITIAVDIFILWPDAAAFLSDQGIYPRRLAMGSAYGWSLYFVSGTVLFSHALMGLTFLAAIFLLIGYRTRLMTILCWVLIVSLDTRITGLISGADTYLRLLLFWAMFLPLGARYSVDEAMNKAPDAHHHHFSAATAAILAQVTCLYLFSALLKTGIHWVETHHAVYFALATPEITTPLAPFLVSHVALLQAISFSVYYLELLAVFFLFSPVLNPQSRLLILSLLALMHIGFALLLSIGIFPLVCLAGLTVFLPSLFWERFLPKRNQKILIYFDEACDFCRKTCLIFRALGMPAATQISPAQDKPEIREILERENSWVVEDGTGKRRIKWDAVSWCWRRSPILWPLGVLFMIPPLPSLGNRIYGFIALNRGDFGKLSARLLPEVNVERAPPLTIVVSYGLAALAIVVVAWNIATLNGKPNNILPAPISAVVYSVKIQQRMNFFAPQPISRTRWVVIEGDLLDGRKVDALFERTTQPAHSLPANGFEANPGYRWRKLFSSMNFEKNRNSIGRYFCKRYEEWKTSDMPALKTIWLSVYRQKTPMPGEQQSKKQRLLYTSYDCVNRKSKVVEKLKLKPKKQDDSNNQGAPVFDPFIDSILNEPSIDQ